jgi:hypothetical protein
MIDGSVPVISICRSLRQQYGFRSLDSLKRKLRPVIRLVRYGEVSHLLSSMSNPPSPRRTPQHEPVSPSQDPHIPESAASRSSPAPMSTLAIAATSPASQFYDPVRRHYELERPHSGHASHMTAAQQSEQAIHSLANAAALQSAALPTSQPHSGSTSQRTSQPPSSSSLHLSTSSRGRKAKAHVASACINCKRAHLSCDVSRPCTRCVSSGKQVCTSR